MTITIAICTHNRSRDLERTLKVLGESVQDWSGVEVLVVDNGSTDGTPAVLHERTTALPLRVVYEPTLGLSHARNRVLRETPESTWVLWIDDDVDVAPTWLDAYRAAIREHPDASFFGGPIRPLFERQPSALGQLLVETFPQMFSLLEPPDHDHRIEARLTPYGANMLIRRSVMSNDVFDPALGVSGRSPGVGEETELFEAILGSGRSGWWVPGGAVRHRIPDARVSIEFAERWWTGAAYSDISMAMRGCHTAIARARMLLYLTRVAVVELAKTRDARRIPDSAPSLKQFARNRRARGMLSGLWNTRPRTPT